MACQCSAAHLCRYAERRRYGVAGPRVADDRLAALRELAVRELVSAALVGRGGPHAASRRRHHRRRPAALARHGAVRR